MDDRFTYYRPLSSDFLWIYEPMHCDRTDSLIANGADIEYTKKITFMVDDPVLE